MPISKDVLGKHIQRLGDAFNMVVPKVRLQALYEQLKGGEERHLENATTYLINNKASMPINADIIIATGIERDREWQDKKNIEMTQARDFFNPYNKKDGLKKDAIVCVNKILEARTREEKVGLMLEMENKYPNIGYATEANKFKNQRRY